LVCKVELLCIGNELLIGKTLNTNSQWLSEKITKLGGDVTRVTVVGDDVKTIASALRETLRRRPDVVVTSGGLGPTFDDKTLQAFSKAFRRQLQLNRNALRLVSSRYAKVLGKKDPKLTPPRLKMAMLPVGAKAVPNPVGTAPAVTLTASGVKFLILPGVPAELQAIFEQSFAEPIKKMAGRQFPYETNIVISGLLESQVAPLIDRVMSEVPEIYVKSHAKGGEGTKGGYLELHFSTRARSVKTARDRILRAVTLMSQLLGSLDEEILTSRSRFLKQEP